MIISLWQSSTVHMQCRLGPPPTGGAVFSTLWPRSKVRTPLGNQKVTAEKQAGKG